MARYPVATFGEFFDTSYRRAMPEGQWLLYEWQKRLLVYNKDWLPKLMRMTLAEDLVWSFYCDVASLSKLRVKECKGKARKDAQKSGTELLWEIRRIARSFGVPINWDLAAPKPAWETVHAG